jgi:predicted membrane channel-forming protein YqfA (hemolysin III family)
MVGGVSAFAIAGIYMKWKAPADTPVGIGLWSESILVGVVAVIVVVALFRTLSTRTKD